MYQMIIGPGTLIRVSFIDKGLGNIDFQSLWTLTELLCWKPCTCPLHCLPLFDHWSLIDLKYDH